MARNRWRSSFSTPRANIPRRGRMDAVSVKESIPVLLYRDVDDLMCMPDIVLNAEKMMGPRIA